MRLIDADKLMERLEEEQRIHAGNTSYLGGLAGAGILIAEAPTVAMRDDNITINWTPDIDRLAREVAYQGLDTFSFLGKSIREWVEIILEPTAHVWISVKDRLPDDPPWATKWVAVWFGEGSEIHTEVPLVGKYNPAKKTWWVLGNTLGKPGDRMKITHWIYLPEPPEEEDE